MSDFEALPPRLQHLGRQLVAAADELHSTPRVRRRWWSHPSRRFAAGIAVAALAVPAAAIAATQLTTTAQVAASLPQGSLVLMGTDPTCTVVQADVEYRCVLASPPNTDATPGSTTTGGSESAQNWHPPVEAVATTADGKQVLLSQPTLEALKNEIAAAHLTHVTIAGKDQTLSANTADGTVTVTSNDNPPSATDWTGAIELTVDASKHLNGACRGLNATGTEWECYIGEAAVEQNMIARSLLGQYTPSPTVG